MKKLIIIILIIALAIGGGFLYYYFSGNKISEEIGQSNSENEVKEEEKVIPDTVINMTVTGDILCHNTQFLDAYESTGDTYDFSYVFEDIKKYFDNSDIAIGTLETNFAGKEIGYSNYPLFNSPEELAFDLKELGYDILATAQNHCLDKGYNGLVNTLKVLDDAQIEHMGTYSSEEDSQKILIKDVKGVKIGFLNYTYGTNGISIPDGKEYAVNLIEEDKIKSDIQKAKEEGAEFICVNMHWGEEYRENPTEEQEELADFLFQNGVDLILGSHTHCLEPMEKRTVTLEDGTTKDGFVIYSLGNFMSGQRAENTRQSVILDIQITKHGESGEFTIDSVDYTPIYMYNVYNGKALKNFKILDIEEEIRKYESGDTAIGSSLYNTLKSELEHVVKVMGEEI